MEHTKRLTMGAILTALALALSYMERFFPLQLLIPLPGVKLGLANLVTVFALYFLTVREAGMILILRCALGSLFSTGVTAFLFSIGGGILALLVMAALKRCKGLSLLRHLHGWRRRPQHRPAFPSPLWFSARPTSGPICPFCCWSPWPPAPSPAPSLPTGSAGCWARGCGCGRGPV